MNRSGPAQILIASLAFALSMVLPAGAEIPEAAAKEYAKKGALVVDVRTVEEFNARRLTNAINIPVADVKVKFPKVVTNKTDVVLLHCRSGRRSGIAETELRAMGYTNVFNIGSYERAEKILKAAGR